MDEAFRERARRIAQDASLTEEERARQMQNLYRQAGGVCQEETKVQSGMFVEGSTVPDPLPLEGCNHYKRQCDIVAKCCGQRFCCRLCHDEKVFDHRIDRFATELMVCRECGLIQKVNERCTRPNCTFQSSKYFCETCRLWVNDERKQIFHCDKCGLCRVGKRDEYTHCDECHLCFRVDAFDDHVCSITKTDCSICGEDLQSSTINVIPLPCKHALHDKCYKQAVRSGLTSCPVCRRSFGDASIDPEYFEQLCREHPMPEQFAGLEATISCNDCNEHSQVPYHFIGHMCSHCHSINTFVVSRPAARTDPSPE